jgi:DNA-directed RNA polymerase specialized sigma24 family protein
MATDSSVSDWIRALKARDQAAAWPLWQRYFKRLVSLARKRLQGRRPLIGDPEDVALSAFASFCRAAAAGRFPDLADRDGLWPLLLTITVRKAAYLLRYEGRRPGGAAALPGDGAAGPTLEEILGREPDPALAAEVAEQYERLLRLLDDQNLQDVALWRMEGDSVEEIAARLDCCERTVKRKLRTIRRLWKEAGP